MKTASVIQSYSKKFKWFLYQKGKHMTRVSYYHGLVFGGIDQHTTVWADAWAFFQVI